MSAPKPKKFDPQRDAGDDASSGEDARLLPGTGRVKFDDRGNASWEWSIATGRFGQEVTPERLDTLQNPTLAILEEAQPGAHPLGAKKKGYDPYDSSRFGTPPAAKPRKKTDLRRLGEFLKLKKQVANNKKSRDDT